MKIVLFTIISIMIGVFSLNAYGDLVEETNDSAYVLMKNEDYVAAIEEYTKVLQIDPNNEKALLNRAVAFAKIGDDKLSLNDFSLVLKNDPENLTALNGKSTILSNFKCESYNNCGPLQSLQILEEMLVIDPNSEKTKLKRNFMFTEGYDSIPKFAIFDVRETNGDYIVNIQHVIRDRDGNLVSVIENAGTSISPTMLTERYLDAREGMASNFKKEVVKIEEDDYIKWSYEIQTSYSEVERKFFGLSKSGVTVSDGKENGREMFLKVDLMTAIFPAVNVDVGDNSIKIIEVFKRI